MLSELKGRVLIGLSGGADSVALFRMLLPLRDEGHIVLFAVHVDHGIRGEAAHEDAAFAEALCREHAVPLDVVRLIPPPHASENWAREARYQAFSQVYHRHRIQHLVLAHHQDDQAETVLLHLLRGSGSTGLAGMKADTVRQDMHILRPLLNMTHRELCDQLRSLGQDWREDATNASDAYLRNRIRSEVLPLMEQMIPGASRRIARTAELMSQEDDLLEQLAAGQLAPFSGATLPLCMLQELHPALLSRVLRQWVWRESRLQLDHAATLRLAELTSASTGTVTVLLQDLEAYRGRTHLHLLLPQVQPEPVDAVPGSRICFGTVTIEVTAGGKGPGNGKTRQELPAALLAGCCFRTRRKGDFIIPFGSSGRQSLQDYLVNRHIDAPFRERIPLLAKGSEILLVGGVGAGRIPGWQPEEDNLAVCFSGVMPWCPPT